MEKALSLAQLVLGTTSPNPAVGAVVVKGGAIVGEGWTKSPGQPHAEIMALRQAGTAARDGTLFVTLEPCCHWGRTPPCTDAIIEAGVAEVHMAVLDPNPLVDGKGAAQLKRAGVRTHVGEEEEEARVLVEAHAKFITTGLPFVVAKFAVSLDGKIATRTGDSKWITGSIARKYAHQLRSTSDAIMIGVNTVIADDPRLTARSDDDRVIMKHPLRVIVDSKGRTPYTAKLFQEPGKILIAAASIEGKEGEELKRAGVDVVLLPAGDSSVDINALMKLLGQREVTSVLVEGGGTLLGSLFDEGLVDKVVAFIAPMIIGGKEALSPVAGDGVERVSQALRLSRVRVEHLEPDIAVIGYCEV
ncbi:MAG: bifunctional diaminohydroxyphosphoribosylaminopyrimidine deaminase/5-amino-6-(5-phosphoribosylamino)uracil reductase RibD [Chloroflexi bacterium]|nr:bifunctional diaminohydroxyphosphoribosylaminopyrimidine deaminase/5-amino-6-(5-phosphoribosylamino)uracil reductase RibD [Chloroflexota bacterium]